MHWNWDGHLPNPAHMFQSFTGGTQAIIVLLQFFIDNCFLFAQHVSHFGFKFELHYWICVRVGHHPPMKFYVLRDGLNPACCTTGKQQFAMCSKLCRVPDAGHTTTILSAVCNPRDTRQSESTWQITPLSCVDELAHGKPDLCNVLSAWRTVNLCHVRSTRSPVTSASLISFGGKFEMYTGYPVLKTGHVKTAGIAP